MIPIKDFAPIATIRIRLVGAGRNTTGTGTIRAGADRARQGQSGEIKLGVRPQCRPRICLANCRARDRHRRQQGALSERRGRSA